MLLFVSLSTELDGYLDCYVGDNPHDCQVEVDVSTIVMCSFGCNDRRYHVTHRFVVHAITLSHWQKNSHSLRNITSSASQINRIVRIWQKHSLFKQKWERIKNNNRSCKEGREDIGMTQWTVVLEEEAQVQQRMPMVMRVILSLGHPCGGTAMNNSFGGMNRPWVCNV